MGSNSLKQIMCRLFLSRGANVFLKNREGETAPDCCSHSSKAWAVLQANRKERGSRIGTEAAEEKVLHRLETIAAGPERPEAIVFFTL